ncbi:MAG: ABC transporter permease [Planctomycetaceae bacterium]|jgi:hypothetical protein|nr:ABC transporter permease [Planctomycetaceae bacterium]
MKLKQFSVNINPILLRELRQQVRNRFIIVLINLYVVGLVLVCLMSVLFQQTSSQIHDSGGYLFGSLSIIMGMVGFVMVVTHTAQTTTSERINGDLMFTSALKPSTIVFGKALAGAILTVLLMSITAPFVMVAYLLRGLDIEFVIFTFISIFTTIQVFNGMAICICSNIRTKVQMVVLLGGGFFVVILGIQILLSFIFSYVLFGHGYANWSGLIVSFLFAGMIFAVFLAGAITSIAPTASNRLLPIRLTVTAIYFVSFLISFIIPPFSFTTNPLVLWVYSWTIAVTILLVMVVCEQETWSVRIKRTLPKHFIFRIFLFPFYTGAANGLVWLILLGLGIFLVAVNQTGESFNLYPFGWLLFSFDYCVTAMLIRSYLSYLFPKPIPSNKVLTIIFILFCFFVLGGMLTAFLFQNSTSFDFYDMYSKSIFSALNPFLLKENIYDSWFQIISASFWGLGLIVPLFIWFISCIRRFSPKNIDEILTLEQAVAAIREAEANPLVQSDRERANKNNSASALPTPST